MEFISQLKKTGDLIKAEDWNDAMEEIERLGEGKLDIAGGVLFGSLTIKSSPPSADESANDRSESTPWKLEIADGDVMMSAKNAALCFKPTSGGAGIRYSTEQSALSFYNGPDSDSRLVITSEGNLGFGTSDIQGKLHIRSVNDKEDKYSGIRFYPAGDHPNQEIDHHVIAGFRHSGLWLSGSSNGSAYSKSNILLNEDDIQFQLSDGNSKPTRRFRIHQNGWSTVYSKLRVQGADPIHTIYRNRGNYGKKMFMELFQQAEPGDPYVYPSIRFHQGHRFWIRIEGRNNGFHFKAGDINSDTYTNIYAASFSKRSDIRLKQNISDLNNGLFNILKIKGISFEMKENETIENPTQYGFSAQEVEKVFPELVSEDEAGLKYLNYDGLLAPIVEAIKEQQQQIEELKDEIKTLKSSQS